MVEIDKIYCEDCLETLKRMDDESIDMVLCSPPYDNLRKYNGYAFDFENIAKELTRVLKQGGTIIWVVNDAMINGSRTLSSFRQAIFFKDECGLNVNDVMIYNKTQYLPRQGQRYQNCYEYMFCFTKGKPKTFNPIMEKCKNVGKILTCSGNRTIDGRLREKNGVVKEEKVHSNIFTYPTSNGTKDKIAFQHPAVFPELLANDMIISWSNEGDIVYDPFMGSGTTAKMAKENGRHFIGSEISPDYVKIAEERLGIL